MERAEVTAFLSLIFILLVSFTGGIMESASTIERRNTPWLTLFWK